jgi:hypothetical protein
MYVYFKAACLPLNIRKIRHERGRLCQYFSCGTGHSPRVQRYCTKVRHKSHTLDLFSLFKHFTDLTLN